MTQHGLHRISHPVIIASVIQLLIASVSPLPSDQPCYQASKRVLCYWIEMMPSAHRPYVHRPFIHIAKHCHLVYKPSQIEEGTVLRLSTCDFYPTCDSLPG